MRATDLRIGRPPQTILVPVALPAESRVLSTILATVVAEGASMGSTLLIPRNDLFRPTMGAGDFLQNGEEEMLFVSPNGLSTSEEVFEGTDHSDIDSPDDETSIGTAGEDVDVAKTTVILIAINNKTTGEEKNFTVLLDSGSSTCLATSKALKRAGIETDRPAKIRRFKTAAGTFAASKCAKIRTHQILELSNRRKLQNLMVQVSDGDLGPYDFIFGRDYMTRYGIDLMFSSGTIHWDGEYVPMKDMNAVRSGKLPLPMPSDDVETETKNSFTVSQVSQLELDHFRDLFHTVILSSKYEKQDLEDLAKKQKHLNSEQQSYLHALFEEYSDLFQGNLGLWPKEQVSASLRPDAKPYHCRRPIRIAHRHRELLAQEIDRLCAIRVLEKIDASKAGPWCAPSFIIPKKDNRIRFITDFRELNKWIERRPHPMPHIIDMLNDIGTYTYVTALDLSMGYYHFELDDKLKDLCTFMLPTGLYRYLRLPMGLNISPDLFQEKMEKLFCDMPNMKVYIDDLLIFSNGSYEDHLAKVKEALDRLHQKNMAVNAEKSFWAVREVDYLGSSHSCRCFAAAKEGRRYQEYATPNKQTPITWVHWPCQFLPIHVEAT